MLIHKLPDGWLVLLALVRYDSVTACPVLVSVIGKATMSQVSSARLPGPASTMATFDAGYVVSLTRVWTQVITAAVGVRQAPAGMSTFGLVGVGDADGEEVAEREGVTGVVGGVVTGVWLGWGVVAVEHPARANPHTMAAKSLFM